MWTVFTTNRQFIKKNPCLQHMLTHYTIKPHIIWCYCTTFSAPKEKPCCTLPTVKKLLEEKRRRETSSVPPLCSTANTSPVPQNTVTVRPHTGRLNISLNTVSCVKMLLFMLLFFFSSQQLTSTEQFTFPGNIISRVLILL